MGQTPMPTETEKPKSRTMVLAIIIVAILVVVGIGVYFLTRPSPGPTGPQVTIKDDGGCASTDTACLFTPTTINANVSGLAVVWTNQGTIGHTVTTCDTANSPPSGACPNGMDASGLDSFNSPTIGAGSTYSHIFTKAGTYYYYCAIHPLTMHGEVIVS
jgi:plastocyanin